MEKRGCLKRTTKSLRPKASPSPSRRSRQSTSAQCRSPERVERPSLSHKQKSVSFRADGTECEIHRADDWDRTPVRPSQISDDDIEEMKKLGIKINVASSHYALPPIGSRHFGFLSLLPQTSSSTISTGPVSTPQQHKRPLFDSASSQPHISPLQIPLNSNANAIMPRSRNSDIIAGANTQLSSPPLTSPGSPQSQTSSIPSSPVSPPVGSPPRGRRVPNFTILPLLESSPQMPSHSNTEANAMQARGTQNTSRSSSDKENKPRSPSPRPPSSYFPSPPHSSPPSSSSSSSSSWSHNNTSSNPSASASPTTASGFTQKPQSQSQSHQHNRWRSSPGAVISQEYNQQYSIMTTLGATTAASVAFANAIPSNGKGRLQALPSPMLIPPSPFSLYPGGHHHRDAPLSPPINVEAE